MMRTSCPQTVEEAEFRFRTCEEVWQVTKELAQCCDKRESTVYRGKIWCHHCTHLYSPPRRCPYRQHQTHPLRGALRYLQSLAIYLLEFLHLAWCANRSSSCVVARLDEAQ